ncbi:GSCFA domain-containing protein [Synechococcus sp. MU1648]|uniref:GSCFA domain-containing protein n=1 Tax=Synechococcus sp. MU1648 TaxID=2508351 RepID=UPI0020275331|nr:GSCFA domain-containing protein [Synechococcus sp. MU1648]
MNNPYLGLSDKSFWKKAVAEKRPESLDNIYTKKFLISQSDHIATAGSCFAQHVSRSLKSNGFKVLDKESCDYSANYGNIYTVAQLLQLAKESIGEIPISNIAWEKDGNFIDALRPGAISSPINSSDEVTEHRLQHLQAVRSVLKELDVFIFTLGLTEAWIRRKDKVVFPSAPGVIAGEFNDKVYKFKNYSFDSIISDFKEFFRIVKAFRGGKGFKTILTVSPVPLTATASKQHILVANTYSKATLRAVAAKLSERSSIDYFPSYEVVTNPRYYQGSYDSNLRTVKQSTVDNVMKYFFLEHCPFESINTIPSEDLDIQCEEQLLEMYSDLQNNQLMTSETRKCHHTEIIGDSHMNSFVKALKTYIGHQFANDFCIVDRRVIKNGINPKKAVQTKDICTFANDGSAKNIKLNKFAKNAREQVERFETSKRTRLIFVGGLMGDNFLRFHGTFTEKMSPEIPMISCINEIPELFDSKITQRLTYAKRIIQQALTCLQPKDIRWIVSPLPSESCALIRFGSIYLNSYSQIVYNTYFNELLDRILGDYIKAGIVLAQPSTSISDTGFSLDKYAIRVGTDDVHLNEDYFRESIPNILSR